MFHDHSLIISFFLQVDDNWYEGERNAMIGIFPVTYVEMIPNENVGSLSPEIKIDSWDSQP